MSNKTIQTLIGVALIGAGIAGWFLLPERGELVVVAMVGFGGFLVSQSKTAAFGKAVADLVRGIRS